MPIYSCSTRQVTSWKHNSNAQTPNFFLEKPTPMAILAAMRTLTTGRSHGCTRRHRRALQCIPHEQQQKAVSEFYLETW